MIMTKKGNLHVKKRVPGRFVPMGKGPMLVHALRAFRTYSPGVRLVIILPIRRHSC